MGLTGNDIMKPVRRFNQHKLILDENTNAQFLLLLIKKLKYQLLSWTIRINLLTTYLAKSSVFGIEINDKKSTHIRYHNTYS